jgi:oligoribonuclease NrnB/cAMP/cGMP phosphodiesterase (DHH superfamily)
MKTMVLYHSPCADGFTAAWVCGNALGWDNVELVPVNYGQPPPAVIGRDVLIVDFSYKRDVLEAMHAVAEDLYVLDHHKTAAADLAGLSYARFDMNRSGAQMAWDYFFSGQRPQLVDYVADRDLWKFEMPASREVSAYISAFEQTRENWDELDEVLMGGGHDARTAGAVILLKQEKDIRELVEGGVHPMVIGGYAVPALNVPPTMSSEAGHAMVKKGVPFVACYRDGPRGREFSLRSTDEGVDVSEIAKKFGGGGHRNAAGFTAAYGWCGEKETTNAA